MSSFYNRRASYVASWARQPIYRPPSPTFGEAVAPSEAPAPQREHDTTLRQREEEDRPPAVEAERPPPVYFPGQSRTQRVEVRDGHIRSINTASSKTSQIAWSEHPSLFAESHEVGKSDVESNARRRRAATVTASRWKRFARPWIWYRCLLLRQPEQLSVEWPEAFGPNYPRSRSFSVGEQDSGVALTPFSTMDGDGGTPATRALKESFQARIATLNEVIPAHLRRTRTVLAALEAMDLAFIILLIVALAVTGGKQKRFLQGVEVSLVVLILLNGAAVNHVRIRRWALAKQLRQFSRDWSPLPITSSTNRQLVGNYDGEDGGRVEDLQIALPQLSRRRSQQAEQNQQWVTMQMQRQPPEASQANHPPATVPQEQEEEDKPILRWSMRRTEGSWWISYRPLIRVELVTPSSATRFIPLQRPESFPPPPPALVHDVDVDLPRPAPPLPAATEAPPSYEEGARSP